MRAQLLLFLCTSFVIANSQNSWLQKADCGGVARKDAVGFSIGNKGYIGTGYGCDSVCAFRADFWEWDQGTNVWTQKADLAGGPRAYAVGFSVGTKGYIATGSGIWAGPDLWEWDQATNMWTQKANFSGGNRENAVAFSIGTKGYIGTGMDPVSYSFMQDFWEYDP